MANLRVGDPLDKSIDIGAIVAPVQLERITSLVEARARRRGARSISADDRCPTRGCFYPPTLVTGTCDPASTLAIEEIFGPVLVAMTFRTPDEAVAARQQYALRPRRQRLDARTINLRAGCRAAASRPASSGSTRPICSTPASASAAIAESGFGREGGREGVYEYLKPKALERGANRARTALALPDADRQRRSGVPPIDRTAKLFIGGKQVRPDGNYSRAVLSPKGQRLGEVGEGNRKDIRNAVAAARGAEAWSKATAHNRAQVLYYLAENLSARAAEFAARIAAMTGVPSAKAMAEVDAEHRAAVQLWRLGRQISRARSTRRRCAVWRSRCTSRSASSASPVLTKPPLLGFVSLVAPLIAMGNRVVVVPSERHPLAATDFYQALETSDVPAGVVNIVTGGTRRPR